MSGADTDEDPPPPATCSETLDLWNPPGVDSNWERVLEVRAERELCRLDREYLRGA